jgi:alanine racemase
MTYGAAHLPLRCWAEIDLGALERNLKHIRAALPSRLRYVAVVKADAYGHGLPQTVTRLMHAGADLFAVANLAEAAAIREIGPGWPVLVLGPLLPEEDRFLADYDVTVTVSSAAEVARFDAVGRAAGRPVSVHLKIDTGMGRAGAWHPGARAVYDCIRAAAHVRLDGVYTHFSSADSDRAFTRQQRSLFLAVLRRLPGLDRARLFVHADNSAGLDSLQRRSPFNAVRVGLLQFGVPSTPGAEGLLARVPVEPVFSFHTRVGLVKRLPRGTGISYNRTHRLRRASTVAVLTAGYGDGLPLAASGRAEVLLHGHRCPVLGRVTMDQTMVDVTDVPAEVHCGDHAVLVGPQRDASIDLREFARWAETIPYEILCSVTKRVPRLYRTPLGV